MSLRKAMKRSRLKRVANTTKRPEDLKSYKRQRNLVVNMNRREKKTFFAKLERNSENKCFWKTIKPLFNEKGIVCKERITLVNNDTIHKDESEISNIFNDHFNGITDNLNTPLSLALTLLSVNQYLQLLKSLHLTIVFLALRRE